MYIFVAMKANFLIIFLLSVGILSAQESINGSFSFQNDPNKLYSAYIPSNYNEDVAHTTIIAFHPFNVNRWDAQAWCDTLIVFAESVDAILICPDGGADGKVDDAIDTAFTSFLIDTLQSDYNLDQEQMYLAGFSWGGRTAYTYGLHRPGKFKGYLIAGAAVNGTSEVGSVLDNAPNENFYLVHGTNDQLNTRHTIISNALIDNNACVESNLLFGVGHTIDFPNRNSILKDGFDYLVENACITSSNSNTNIDERIEVYPNPSRGLIQIDSDIENLTLEFVFDMNGKQIPFTIENNHIACYDYQVGLYYLQFKTKSGKRITRKLILD